MSNWTCDGCGLEHSSVTAGPPADGCVFDRGPVSDEELGDLGTHTRRWLTQADLAAEPHRTEHRDLGRGLHALRREPRLGIGHWTYLVQTDGGNLMWDPPAYFDDEILAMVTSLGGVTAIATSHPHMFAAQITWSRAVGDVPVWANELGLQWLPRASPVIETWRGDVEPVPGVRVLELGGHMPSSAVALTADGTLLTGDTIAGGLDPGWVSFQRNFPRHVPLSASVVQRLVDALEPLQFDRLYTLGGDAIATAAHDVVRRAAHRHIAWVSGQFDHLT